MHWEEVQKVFVFLETDQNETSLWLKQEQIFACGLKKLNLI